MVRTNKYIVPAVARASICIQRQGETRTDVEGLLYELYTPLCLFDSGLIYTAATGSTIYGRSR